MSDLLDSRRRWFEEYTRRVDQGVTHPPLPGTRYACPCCGHPTLTGRGHYDICELCNWEDDGQDDPHADEVWGGPNGSYSLTEARNNFEQYLIMYSPDKPASTISGNSNTELEQQAKQALVETFAAMINKSDPSALDVLWQRVYENEQILQNELERQVRAYEVQMKSKGSAVTPTA